MAPLWKKTLESPLDCKKIKPVHGVAKESDFTEWPTLVGWVRGETVGPRG